MFRPILAAACLVAALAVPSTASAYVLGVGDRADGDPQVSRSLGARVYRVVIDPDVPLAAYDARIYRFRAAGMEPQLVVGGTGTRRHAHRWGLERVALAAYHRWPFVYSISVVNEPDISGMSACAYARTYQRAYRLLKRAGVRRVLFGEWSPVNPLGWTHKILTRCGVRLHVDRFAWHCYDQYRFWTGGVGNTPVIRRFLHKYRSKLGGHTPLLHCTEYGAILRFASGPTGEDEVGAIRRWRAALRIGSQYLAELVAWDIHSPDSTSAWDSSLVEPDGRERPAFHVVRQGVGSRP